MKGIVLGLIFIFGLTNPPAWGQILLTDFEEFTPLTVAGTALFRNPSYSGTTAGYLDYSIYDSSIVESIGVPAGNPNAGVNTLHVAFDFKDTPPPGTLPKWLRLTTGSTLSGTSAGSILPNPTIGLWPGWGVKFDICSDTPIYVASMVRETETGAALAANGGILGNVEFVGGNPLASTNRGKVVAAHSWTTLVFSFSDDQVFTFTGNGVLNPGADNKGVLEALAISTDEANVNPINLWIDNVEMVPEPSQMSLAVLGGLCLFWRLRRQ